MPPPSSLSGSRAASLPWCLASLACLACRLSLACAGPAGGVPEAGFLSLWPLPHSVAAGPAAATVAVPDPASFSFAAADDPASGCLPADRLPSLASAFQRLPGQVFWAAGSRTPRATAAAGLTGVIVCVTGDDAKPVLGVDESYTLRVPAGGGVAVVNATTQFGAMHALQTLRQLVVYDYSVEAYAVAGVPLTVTDQPRYAWRGLLVDTARHYLPPAALKRQIDAMEASKLNVLHWHVVDAQSFPFQSTTYPALSGKGAYHPLAVFSPAAVAGVVQYGAERGVRVMPEFDVPGHSASWGDAYPGVVTDCPSLAHNINNLNLSPADNMTLTLVQGVLGDAAALWDDEFIHLGGDEVVESCWSDDPAVVAWMSAHGLDTHGVYEYFVNHTTAMVTALGRRTIQWQEVIDNSLHVPLTTVIEAWKGEDVGRITALGYEVVVASGYYLDMQEPDPPATFYEFVDTWKSMYAHDPAANLTDAQAKLVIGGEAAMWGEQVADGSIDTRVWPRAAAVAERLWSLSAPPASNATTTGRLNAHSCRLQRAGIGSSPVEPAFCLMPSMT